jgi:hypothetical protein
MDHPILRAHASLDPHSKYHFFEEKIIYFFPKGAEAQSQLRRPGESELDYYERRYQERVNFVFINFKCFLSFLLATSFSWYSCSI